MPLKRIVYAPGVNKENTNYANEGGWFECDKIRFRSGYPEKIGGWTQLSTNTFLGVARQLINWATLVGSNLLGIGTNLKYYIEQGGAYNDITPITSTHTYNNVISTAYSTLNGAINTTARTLTLASATGFPPQGLIQIGTEQILYSGVSGNSLLNLTRGWNQTTPASHGSGANVGCTTLTLTDAYNVGATGQYILISGASAIAGISAVAVNGDPFTGVRITESLTSSGVYYYDGYNYQSGQYEFSTSSVTNSGGAITVNYLLEPGLDIYVNGTGWGAGKWSRGTWGSAATTGVSQQLRLLSADTFGQDLVIAPRGGTIYYWSAVAGISARAEDLATIATAQGYEGQFVPNATNQIIGSAVQRFLIAFGANGYDPTNSETEFDPLLVRWSDQENPYQWVPSITNQAGEQRLSIGSYIVAARNTRQEILVWTDSAIYSMQYLGPPYVWKLELLQGNITMMGPNVAITINNVTYWMGTDKFFVYSGRVEALPCTLRQYVFGNLNYSQAWQCFAGSLEEYNEVWWFYPSKNSTAVDSYVVYNYLDKVWYYGTLNRTAWLDSGIRRYPMGADYNGRIIYHENGVDDVSTATPQPIYSYIQSSDFDIDDGQHLSFVWRILPDVSFDGSTATTPFVNMQVRPRLNSGTNYGVAANPEVDRTETYPVQQFTGQVYTRLRGRQLAFKIESTDLGVAWSLGAPRIDIRPDGRR
jgi:hypothetical protein